MRSIDVRQPESVLCTDCDLRYLQQGVTAGEWLVHQLGQLTRVRRDLRGGIYRDNGIAAYSMQTQSPRSLLIGSDVESIHAFEVPPDSISAFEFEAW